MKKDNNFIIILLILFLFLILKNSNLVINTSILSFNIWIKTVFPSLFPFFVISGILINYGFVSVLANILKKPFHFLFKISSSASFVLVMSIISGFPSNAKYTKELLEKNMITKEEASKIILFTHFSNPLFILGALANVFLKNYKAALLVLIIHYSINFIIGIIFRNYNVSNSNIENNNCNISNNFGYAFTNSIINSINTLLLILGTITIFLIFTNLISSFFKNNFFLFSLINSFMEMTQGLNYICNLNISLKIKTILSSMILSFGGLSVHMQVISILSDYNIKYLPYLFARLLHCFLSGLLIMLLFDLAI